MLGVNTARSLTFKGGRINEEQIESLRRRFQALPASLTKIVVTHHPFDIPDEPDNEELVGRAAKAMAAFADCGVDILLSGHFHASRSGETSRRHPLAGYAALAVQAGTATSTRGRGESNSFNVLHVEHDAVALEPQCLAAGSRRLRRRTDRALPSRGAALDRGRLSATAQAASWSCSSRHITLPEPDFGSASTNWTIFGTL